MAVAKVKPGCNPEQDIRAAGESVDLTLKPT